MFVTCTTVTTNIAACRGVTLCGVAEVYRLVTGICFRHHGHWVNLTRKWLANSGDFSVYGCARLRDVTSRGKEHTKICNAVCLFLGRAIRFLWLNTVFLMPLPYLQSEVVTGSGNAFTLYAEEVHRLSKLHFFFFWQSLQWILGNRPIFKYTFPMSIPFTANFCGHLWTVTVDKVPLKYTYLPKT